MSTVGTVNGVVSEPQADPPVAAYAPVAQRRDRKAARWVFIAPAILALSLIANGARQASQRGSGARQSKAALAEAYVKTPFTIRLPKSAPDGAQMVRVYLDEPDSRQGFQAYMLNVWYRRPTDGHTVHVWQSNDKFLARQLADPMKAVGESETVAGAEWHRVVDDRVAAHIVTTYSRRFGDGITMTVDSSDTDLARAAIAELSTDPVQLG